MNMRRQVKFRELVTWITGALLLCVTIAYAPEGDQIDWDKARQLRRRERQGQTLTVEEKEYLERAKKIRRRGRGQAKPGRAREQLVEKSSTGLIPLTDMASKDKYKGEDGGLYGSGRNRPPKAHQEAAQKQLVKIRCLDAKGNPSAGGKIAMISVGMSNTTREFSRFKEIADAYKDKSPYLVIVDCAQGDRDVADWADPKLERYKTVWPTVHKRLKEAGVTAEQVQVAWLKQARKVPDRHGDFPKHAREFQGHLAALVNALKQNFPNLRILYLSSRIYAGYANTALNPEPYAYENAFPIRWVIQEQIKGSEKLNYDPQRGKVTAPVLLWGPYLWADGIKGRKIDNLVYKREDLARDGTHPSKSGMTKVAQQLLKFFKKDPNARTWFVAPDALKKE
jgi:hypothetical protein